MYGLILANMAEYIKKSFGPGKWKEIKEKMSLEDDTFGISETFQEGQAIKIGKTAMKILGLGDEEFYEGMGVFFVALAQDLGYGMLLSCLGRSFRDFFANLDNLHDYLKFTFPRFPL